MNNLSCENKRVKNKQWNNEEGENKSSTITCIIRTWRLIKSEWSDVIELCLHKRKLSYITIWTQATFSETWFDALQIASFLPWPTAGLCPGPLWRWVLSIQPVSQRAHPQAVLFSLSTSLLVHRRMGPHCLMAIQEDRDLSTHRHWSGVLELSCFVCSHWDLDVLFFYQRSHFSNSSLQTNWIILAKTLAQGYSLHCKILLLPP